MKIHIPTWLTDTLKDFRKEIIRYLIVFGGLGAIILAYVTGIGTRLFALISSHIITVAVLILFALFYLLGRRNEKSKTQIKTKKADIAITQHELVQFGNFKWDVTVYSNGHFKISDIPYCAHHDLRLVEKWPLYFCPRFDECHLNISYKDIPFHVGNLESYIEKQLREQRTQQ
jgi:hypothetical protein